MKSVAVKCVALLLASPMAWAQSAGVLPSSYEQVQALAPETDRKIIMEAEGSRKQMEASLQGYLVALEPHHDKPNRKVGVLLTSFDGSPVSLAYDTTSSSVVAQWKLSQSAAFGQRIDYRAYAGNSGAVNFVVSAKFK